MTLQQWVLRHLRTSTMTKEVLLMRWRHITGVKHREAPKKEFRPKSGFRPNHGWVWPKFCYGYYIRQMWVFTVHSNHKRDLTTMSSASFENFPQWLRKCSLCVGDSITGVKHTGEPQKKFRRKSGFCSNQGWVWPNLKFSQYLPNWRLPSNSLFDEIHST